MITTWGDFCEFGSYKIAGPQKGKRRKVKGERSKVKGERFKTQDRRRDFEDYR
jgi:hypothetical protein